MVQIANRSGHSGCFFGVIVLVAHWCAISLFGVLVVIARLNMDYSSCIVNRLARTVNLSAVRLSKLTLYLIVRNMLHVFRRSSLYGVK